MRVSSCEFDNNGHEQKILPIFFSQQYYKELIEIWWANNRCTYELRLVNFEALVTLDEG